MSWECVLSVAGRAGDATVIACSSFFFNDTATAEIYTPSAPADLAIVDKNLIIVVTGIGPKTNPSRIGERPLNSYGGVVSGPIYEINAAY